MGKKENAQMTAQILAEMPNAPEQGGLHWSANYTSARSKGRAEKASAKQYASGIDARGKTADHWRARPRRWIRLSLSY